MQLKIMKYNMLYKKSCIKTRERVKIIYNPYPAFPVFIRCKANARRPVHNPRYHHPIISDVTDATL